MEWTQTTMSGHNTTHLLTGVKKFFKPEGDMGADTNYLTTLNKQRDIKLGYGSFSMHII